MKIEFTKEEVDYILLMLETFKESLDDICDDDRKVQVNYVSQEEADEEYTLIDSIKKKLGE